MQIELYDYEGSACGTKIRWLLSETGAPWERYRVDLLAFDQKTEAYLRLHPEGLVPVARIDGETVTGSDRIMKIIASREGPTPFWPAAAEDRAAVDAWLATVDAFHFSYGAILYAEVFLPAHRARPVSQREAALARIHDPAMRRRMDFLIENSIPADRLDNALAEVAEGFRVAEEALRDAAWLVGDGPTIADIALFPYVNTPMRRVADLWYGKLPMLTAWLARMRARPAYTEAVVNWPYTEELWVAVRNAPGGGGFRPAIRPEPCRG